jgi:hypothetical protein
MQIPLCGKITPLPVAAVQAMHLMAPGTPSETAMLARAALTATTTTKQTGRAPPNLQPPMLKGLNAQALDLRNLGDGDPPPDRSVARTWIKGCKATGHLHPSRPSGKRNRRPDAATSGRRQCVFRCALSWPARHP